MNSLRVFNINKFLYPKGGDATSVLLTGKLLASKGHEVIFWGMKSGKDPIFPNYDVFIDEIDLNSINGIKARLETAGNLLYSLESKRKIEKLIRRVGKPDIVHLHNFAHQISPSVLHVFRKYKIPCVMTMHDYKLVCASYTLLSHGKLCEKCSRGRYFNCFRERCVKDSIVKSALNTIEMYFHHKLLHIYELIDVFISPSQFLKDKVHSMGFKGRIEVLPNFVNFDQYITQYDSQERTIVYFGRLSKEKGMNTLIVAMKGMDVRLKIIGDGPIKSELENKVKTMNAKNIDFLGYKSGDELKNEIRKSMFVIVPSEWYENNPLSIIESFALGKPVIGARIGGIPALVRDNETGFTFESGNVRDLADKIQMLANQSDLIIEMGKKARQFVEMELNSDKYYTQLMGIYQQAIEKKQAVNI